MKSVIVRFGLINGLALLTGFGLSYLLLGATPDNFSKSEIVGYSVMILSSISIYFATKQYKNSLGDTPLGFVAGLGVGFGVSAIGGAFFAAYNWIYVNWLEPNFLEIYLAYSKQQILNSGESQDVINTQLQELADYSALMTNELFFLFTMFMTVFVIGALFSLVTAATLKD